MKFEESWYFLNLIGFRKLRKDEIHWSNQKTNPGNWQFFENKSKKHQVNGARSNIERLFSDTREDLDRLHRPLRDRSIPVPGPKFCQRCTRKEKLEREHIIPLAKGGKDISSNLRWMCNPCHDFRHAEDELLEDLERLQLRHGQSSWQFKMIQYRLDVLRNLNPVGIDRYHSYWEDEKTHYEAWYQRPGKNIRAKPNESVSLDSFVVIN